MKVGERIPIHDHSGFDSGGLVAASTIVSLAGGGLVDSGSSASSVANDVTVLDNAGWFTGTNVEAVLAELAELRHNLEALGDIPLGLAEL